MTWSIKGLDAPLSFSATSATYASSTFGPSVAATVVLTGTGFTYQPGTNLLQSGTITKAELVVNGEIVQRVDIPAGLPAASFFDFFTAAAIVKSETAGWPVSGNDPTDFSPSGNLITIYGATGQTIRIEGTGFSSFNNNGTVTSIKLYAADGITLLDEVTTGLPMPLGYAAAGLGGEFGYYHYLVQGDNTITHLSPNWQYDLEGGTGSDTIQDLSGGGVVIGAIYKQSASAVVVDLTAGTATGGQGADTLAGIKNVFGSNFNDTLIGSVAANVLKGDLGNDTIDGRDGDDRIYGGLGNDSLVGGLANDTLNGGVGNDVMIGGDGVDTADYEDYEGSVAGVTVSLATTAAQNTGGQGVDTLIGIENLNGSIYGDKLTGSSGNNKINGLYGNDSLEGGAGNDTLDGGLGNDTLLGGTGADALFGGGGTGDFVSYAGSSSGVTVSLVAGVLGIGGDAAGDSLTDIENISGSSYADKLTGNAGANRIFSGNGNDTLEGGAGADALFGGGGTGDFVSYAGSSSGVTVSLVAGVLGIGGDAAGDSLTDIENISGSFHADKLTGNAGVNRIFGGNGNDTLEGGAGADALFGGGGAGDFVSYAGSSIGVTVSLVAGVLGIGGDAAGDSLTDIENISGSSHADKLTGNTGANRIFSGNGNDTLDGGLGSDYLVGGSGLDVYVFSTALGASNVDTIAGYSVADDTIHLDDAIFAAAQFGAGNVLLASNFVVGSAATTADQHIIYNSATGALSYDADGVGSGAAVTFANIGTGLALTNADFILV